MTTEAELAAFVTEVAGPDDFDAFWAATLDELRRIPLALPSPLRRLIQK